MTARRTASGAANSNSKHGTETTRAATPCAASSFCASTAIAPPSRWRRATPAASPSAGDDLIGAAGAACCARRASVRSCGRFCRVSASTLGASRASQRELPAFDRLDRVAGPEHEQVRDRAQRGEMLDRLMRRAVLAEPDRVVRHHMDDALAHQRGEPDRRAAIIGEHQERAGIGDDAADAAPCRSSPRPCRARGCRNG